MADRIIVALKKIKKRGHWKKCTFDSGETLELPDEIIIQSGLSVGVSISEKKYNALTSESEIIHGRERAFRLLSYRARSEKELKMRLRKSGIDRTSTDTAINDLKRLHLVDDEEFARRFVHDLIRRKPVGELLIKSELQKKGISDTIINRVIEQTFEEVNPVELARRGMQQWLSRHPRTASGERRQKIARFLYQRGFSRSIIDDVVGESSAF